MFGCIQSFAWRQHELQSYVELHIASVCTLLYSSSYKDSPCHYYSNLRCSFAFLLRHLTETEWVSTEWVSTEWDSFEWDSSEIQLLMIRRVYLVINSTLATEVNIWTIPLTKISIKSFFSFLKVLELFTNETLLFQIHKILKILDLETAMRKISQKTQVFYREKNSVTIQIS